jgi:hypothetical protein
MSFSQAFFDDTKPLIKPKIVCVEEDWKLLCHVFPEPGFRSYFCGHIISKLAQQLKDHGVHDYFDRSGRPEFADLPRFLSNIQLVTTGKTGQTNQPDVGQRVGGAREEAPVSAGKPTDTQKSAVGETKESQVSAGQTGPKSAGYVGDFFGVENELWDIVCPSCKTYKYLEIYREEKSTKVYCRKCEEGCVPPLMIPKS